MDKSTFQSCYINMISIGSSWLIEVFSFFLCSQVFFVTCIHKIKPLFMAVVKLLGWDVCWKQQQFCCITCFRGTGAGLSSQLQLIHNSSAPSALPLLLTLPFGSPPTASFQTTWPKSPARTVHQQQSRQSLHNDVSHDALDDGQQPCAKASDVSSIINCSCWKHCKNLHFFNMAF